jgi:hypothetical protein
MRSQPIPASLRRWQMANHMYIYVYIFLLLLLSLLLLLYIYTYIYMYIYKPIKKMGYLPVPASQRPLAGAIFFLITTNTRT